MPAPTCVLTFSPFILGGYNLKLGENGPTFAPGHQLWRSDQTVGGKRYVGAEYVTPGGVQLAFHACQSMAAAAVIAGQGPALFPDTSGIVGRTGLPRGVTAGKNKGGGFGGDPGAGPGAGGGGGGPGVPTITLSGCVGIAYPYMSLTGLKFRTTVPVLTCANDSCNVSMIFQTPIPFCSGACTAGLMALMFGGQTLPLFSSGPGGCMWRHDEVYNQGPPPTCGTMPDIGQCSVGPAVYHQYLQEYRTWFAWYATNPPDPAFVEWWRYADGVSVQQAGVCPSGQGGFVAALYVALVVDDDLDNLAISFSGNYPHSLGPGGVGAYVAQTYSGNLPHPCLVLDQDCTGGVFQCGTFTVSAAPL